MDNSAKPAKQKKKKGPIRFEAIVPFTIVSALIALYFMLFFDSHLRRGMEWLGSRLNGAEVNIADVDTSFWNASLDILDIQVTDKEKPSSNKVQVGNIRFAMLWDALLRGKFVMNLASVTNIQVGTARKSPGEVFPPETQIQALEILRSQIKGTVLGDIAKMLEGFDPSKVLKDIGANLKSAARVQELRSGLQEKEKAWSAALNSIPGEKDFADLQKRINSIQVSGGKNPAEIQAQVSQITGIISEVDQKIKSVETQGNSLAGDIGAFGKSIGEIDQLVKQDTQDLENRIQLPKLDSKSLARELFGPKIVDQLSQVERYVGMSRDLMPSKFSKEKEAKPVERPRKDGKLYQFGRPNSYPLFWLKKAEFSSRMENTALGGNVSGQLLDLTSSQPQLGKPTRLELTGDFPKSGFMGIRFLATLDHTTEIPMESVKLTAASFPVVERALSSSEDVKFAIAKAVGSAGLEGVLKGDSVDLKFDTNFRDVEYAVAAKSKILESTLRTIVKEVPSIGVQANVTGTWKELGLNVTSNLAAALEQGFQKQLQARVAQARHQIQTLVNDKIGQQRAELTGRYDSIKGKVTGQIDETRKQVEDLKAQANSKLAAVKNQLTPKGIDGLRKKLPF